MSKILAADVGGTKVAVAWVGIGPRGLAVGEVSTYPSKGHAGLLPIMEQFLAQNPGQADATGIGIAGPVSAGRCQATNLPWSVDVADLHQDPRFGRVNMVNDFHAATLGVLNLAQGDWAELNPQAQAPDPAGPVAVLGAGTGLGEAFAVPDGKGGHVVVPTEGGHADFAPRNEEEMALLRFLLKRHGRVSTERVLSGKGLHACYEFILAEGRRPEGAEARAAIAQGEDPASVVSRLALADADANADEALALFMRIYGAEAGNQGLRILATGGVYLTGGIAPKNRPALEAGGFLEAFLAKGRLSPLVASMPCRLVTHPHPGLLGAAAAGALALK